MGKRVTWLERMMQVLEDFGQPRHDPRIGRTNMMADISKKPKRKRWRKRKWWEL